MLSAHLGPQLRQYLMEHKPKYGMVEGPSRKAHSASSVNALIESRSGGRVAVGGHCAYAVA